MSQPHRIRRIASIAITISMVIILMMTNGGLLNSHIAFAQDTTRPLITPENAAEITELGVLDAGLVTLSAIAFSPDGQTLVSGGQDSNLQVWDLASGKSTTLKFPDKIWINTIIFSPDGKQFISAGRSTVVIWDAETHQRSTTWQSKNKGFISCAAYSPDGTLLTICDGETIKLLDAESQKEIHAIPLNANAKAIAFSPDGQTLVSLDGNTAGINFWEVATGKRLKGITLDKIYLDDLAFSNDGKWLVATDDAKLYVWDVATLKLKKTLTGSTEKFAALAFSPHSLVIATVGDTDALQLWDAERGTAFSKIEGQFLVPNGVAFSPDGTLIASASSDGLIYLWGLSESGILPYPELEKFTPEQGHWVGSDSSIDVSFDITAAGTIANFHWKWTIGTSYCSYDPTGEFDIKDNTFMMNPGLIIKGRFRNPTTLLGTSPSSGRCGNMYTVSTGGPNTWWVKKQ